MYGKLSVAVSLHQTVCRPVFVLPADSTSSAAASDSPTPAGICTTHAAALNGEKQQLLKLVAGNCSLGQRLPSLTYLYIMLMISNYSYSELVTFSEISFVSC